jgi:hypothetical protein
MEQRAWTAGDDVVTAALAYHERGWAVVPLPTRAKAPTVREWQKLRVDAADIPTMFSGAGGVGILLGDPSNGLVDVDIDADEARAAWPHFAPPTDLRHGRPSSPSSHWWYAVIDAPPAQTERLRDPAQRVVTLIELRSTGGQTVAPPSVHPSGEAIEWEANGDPAHVAIADLQRAVRRTAAAAMLARRWPEGARHDVALALAGLLLRGGMSHADAERFVEVVARVAGDAEWQDRVRAVRDTADTIAAADPATGGPRLAELIADGPKVVALLREWLGLGAAAEGGGDDPVPLDLWGAADLTGQPVLEADMLPPVIAAMAADEAERLGVDVGMLAIPALVVCAAALDDAHRIQPRRADTGWRESARLWGAIITEPGGRKTPALARVVRPLREIEQEWLAADQSARSRYEIEWRRYQRQVDEHVRRGAALPDEPQRPRVRRRIVNDATTEALADILANTGTGVLALYNELVAWIASHDCYRDRGGGRDRALWLAAYDGGPQVVDRVRRGHVAVPHWSVCVLGGIQPGPLRRLVGRITDDGLVQRLVPIWAGAPGEGVDRPPDAAAGRAYDALIRRLAELPAPGHPYMLCEDAHTERELVAATARHVAVLPTTSDAMRGALAKFDGLFARLLLLYHVAEHDRPPAIVSGDTARRVARLMVLYLLPQVARLYAELVGDEGGRHARWVAGHVLARRLEHISARDIGRAYRELRDDAAAIGAAMDTLTLAGWVVPADDQRPGSPLRRWRVLPAVHRLFGARAAAERERRARERERIAEAARALGLAATGDTTS